VFSYSGYATVYYLSFTTGWGSTFGGAPAVLWNPPLPTLGITTYSNQPVLVFPLPTSFPTSIGTNYVLHMTTNLASGNWVTVTNSIPLIRLLPTSIIGTIRRRIIRLVFRGQTIATGVLSPPELADGLRTLIQPLTISKQPQRKRPRFLECHFPASPWVTHAFESRWLRA
jgi:hypothetical protein